MVARCCQSKKKKKLKKWKNIKYYSEKKPTKISWLMSAKSDTQLPCFIWKELRILWIASKNFSSWDSGTDRETGGDSEKYKNMALKKLTFSNYGALKGVHTFLFSTGQTFCQKLLYHIVAMVVLKLFRIVTRCYAVSFSIKSLFCKTNNIFYNLENRIWDKTK